MLEHVKISRRGDLEGLFAAEKDGALDAADAEPHRHAAGHGSGNLQVVAFQSKDHALELKQKPRAPQRDREIAWRDAKLEKVNFELARLKAWKFGAKTEAMSAEQRRMFEDTIAEDEADLEAQLSQLQGDAAEDAKPQSDGTKRKPRRQALPEHLRRVEHRHEPEDTTCACGQPMTRIGEDVSERLDIVPAEFFVHRHIRGKWACKCCETLVQEPVEPQIIDGGIAASGLVAHVLVSRFVDHLPYYRQEQINARSNVHTPRSTLAAWAGAAGASLMPLYEAHKRFVLSCPVLHADETPVAMLDPGAGKTKRAYVWAYARGELDARHCPASSTTSAWAEARSTPWPSWAQARVHRSHRHGAARWCAISTPDTTGRWIGACTPSASPHIASLMPGASSTSCSTPARWPRRRSGASAGSTESRTRFNDDGARSRGLASAGSADARPLWDELHVVAAAGARARA